MTTAPNQRASLLASLRTGGVRSISGQVPSTAPLMSPSASHFPRSSTVDSFQHSHSQTYEAEALADQFAQMQFVQSQSQTAAPTAHQNAMRMQQQMMYGMLSGNGYSQEEMLVLAQMQRQQQAQLELMRLQVLQQQAQAQAQLLALQAQQQQQAEAVRQYQHTASFDTLRSAASSAAARRASRGAAETAAEPMTAALSGRFGTRLNPQASAFRSVSIAEEDSPPMTAGFIPNPPATAKEPGHTTPPRKSDVATSWRRGSSASPAPLRKTPSPPLSTPTVVVSRPDEWPITPAPTSSASGKSGRRPSPLQLSGSNSPKSVSSVVASSDEEAVDSMADASPPALSNSPTSSSPTSVSPTSAHHPASAVAAPVEAAKRLYEGIGMGRPHVRSVSVSLSASGAQTPSTAIIRQPRGPPCGADELGLRNFATRVRRRAISGLEVLKSARERVPGEEIMVY